MKSNLKTFITAVLFSFLTSMVRANGPDSLKVAHTAIDQVSNVDPGNIGNAVSHIINLLSGVLATIVLAFLKRKFPKLFADNPLPNLTQKKQD